MIDIIPDWVYSLTNPIKWKWWKLQTKIQRFNRGFSWVDCWNMNDWFIGMSIPILEHWIEQGVSFPVIPEENLNTKEDWDRVLTEMLEGFKLWRIYEMDNGIIVSESDLPKPNGKVNKYTWNSEVFDKGKWTKSFMSDGVHYMTHDGVWYKHTMTKDEDKKFRHALQLFVKHFDTLWD